MWFCLSCSLVAQTLARSTKTNFCFGQFVGRLCPQPALIFLHIFIFVSLGVFSFGGVWSILLGSGSQFYLFLSRFRYCCPRARVPTHTKKRCKPNKQPKPTRVHNHSHCRVHFALMTVKIPKSCLKLPTGFYKSRCTAHQGNTNLFFAGRHRLNTRLLGIENCLSRDRERKLFWEYLFIPVAFALFRDFKHHLEHINDTCHCQHLHLWIVHYSPSSRSHIVCWIHQSSLIVT